MIETKKKNVKKKVRFADNLKKPMEAGMMCAIDRDIFFWFTKNTCIRDSNALCYIATDDIGLFDVININELIQGSSWKMPLAKK